VDNHRVTWKIPQNEAEEWGPEFIRQWNCVKLSYYGHYQLEPLCGSDQSNSAPDASADGVVAVDYPFQPSLDCPKTDTHSFHGSR
jgi:hypothetical protein